MPDGDDAGRAIRERWPTIWKAARRKARALGYRPGFCRLDTEDADHVGYYAARDTCAAARLGTDDWKRLFEVILRRRLVDHRRAVLTGRGGGRERVLGARRLGGLPEPSCPRQEAALRLVDDADTLNVLPLVLDGSELLLLRTAAECRGPRGNENGVAEAARRLGMPRSRAKWMYDRALERVRARLRIDPGAA